MSNDAEVRAAVTQEDRIAAADLYRYVADKVKEAHHLDIPRHTMHETLAGEWDHGGFVQAFARHRIAAEARSHDGEWEAMREALKPFSEALGDIAGPDKDRWPDDDTIDFDGFPEFITVGDLRRAREIYTRVSAVPLFDEGRL